MGVWVDEDDEFHKFAGYDDNNQFYFITVKYE